MEMVDDFKRFSIYQNIRYFGPSSNIYFMCKMMDSTPSMNGALSRSGGGKKWSMNPVHPVRLPTSTDTDSFPHSGKPGRMLSIDRICNFLTATCFKTSSIYTL